MSRPLDPSAAPRDPIASGARTLLRDIPELYRVLRAQMGPQHWWPAETRFEIAAGAILGQNTAWSNAARALDGLRDAGALSPRAVLGLDEETLQTLVRPSGYFRAKAKSVRALCEWLVAAGSETAADVAPQLVAGTPTADLRASLLAVRGVGGETADDLLLYVFDRPAFIADTYSRRLFAALGASPAAGYEPFRAQAMARTAERGMGVADLQEFHGLIDEYGKAHPGRDVAGGFLDAYRLEPLRSQ